MPPVYAIAPIDHLAQVEQDKMINESLVKVFPIPARDIINVELPDAFVNTEAVISINSMYGNLLQSTELSGTKSIQLNVSKLPTGNYMLHIVSGTQRINKAISITK
jgi:hypothetical protein